jgi:hypothetical protein
MTVLRLTTRLQTLNEHLADDSTGPQKSYPRSIAERLADDLIVDDKLERHIEILVEAHLERHKLKHNSARPETPFDLGSNASVWVEHITKEENIQAVRSCYIHFAIRLCCLQIHMDKLELV